jgi:hypothetical protein
MSRWCSECRQTGFHSHGCPEAEDVPEAQADEIDAYAEERAERRHVRHQFTDQPSVGCPILSIEQIAEIFQ